MKLVIKQLWHAWEIFKQLKYGTLESNQASVEIFEMNKGLYAHVSKIKSAEGHWIHCF
jgi:hypothetical protein